MDNIQEMMERLRAYQAAHNVQTVSAPKAPIRQTIAPPPFQDTDLDAKIRMYHSQNFSFTIDPKFADLPDISTNMKPVSFTFDDDKYIHEPTIAMVHFEKIEDICRIGRIVIPMMANGFSRYGVGAVFLLAYHLQDPKNLGYYLFPKVYANADDIVLSELSTDVTPISAIETLIGINDLVLEAKTYSFLAASMLRLFTKSEENYLNAFNHILNGFKTFYGVPFPLTITPPNVRALKTFTRMINHGKVFKMSLYKILYAGGGASTNGDGEGMRRFLYEIHLANTGLHIVSIFVRLCNTLNCKPEILISIINAKEYERQINALTHMIQLITDRSENTQRKMWRFGRIFDECFMSSLQTKNNPFLVYVLAAALKLKEAKSNEGIMNIVHFSEINPERKKIGDTIAKILVERVEQLQPKK